MKIEITGRMRMISSWKIRREVKRVGQQLRGLGEQFTDPVAQRRLDLAVVAGLQSINGVLPVKSKVALFLVYQPRGIKASTLETCQWLAAAGYAPLVVSNSPIRAEDRAALAAVAWRAVERPNFGYDFGGYRDGLTCLRQWGVELDQLLILNDSVWLPVLPKTDLMDRLAAHPAEIAGTILRAKGTESFLESYLYRLRRPALEHPAFAKFWAELQLTSNKYHVIRRGERGFSAAMQSAGLRVEGVYDNEALAELVVGQNEDFLRRTLRYGAYIDAAFSSDRDRLLAERGPDWRKAAIIHIRAVLEKRIGYSSFPYAMVQLTGYPLLKKSAEPISRAWRLAYLEAVEAGDLPPPIGSTLAEIRTRDGRR